MAQARGQGLTDCDGVPCVYGVMAGRTSWQAAQVSFAQLENTVLEEQAIALRAAEVGHIDLFISVDKVNVGRISVRPEEVITAGWLIQHYGVPCGITIYRFSDIITLRYPTLLANIRMTGAPFAATIPVELLQILDPAFKPKYQPDMCIDNITDGARNFRWGGFSSARFYYGHPALMQR
jgi:hypothetical protein